MDDGDDGREMGEGVSSRGLADSIVAASHHKNKVLLTASELRLSQTQYKRKNSLNFFKVAVVAAEKEELVRPMPTTALMSSTISENMGQTNSNKVLFGAGGPRTSKGNVTQFQRQPSKPHILLKQYQRAEKKRSKKSLAPSLETYTM